ncbi:type II secretion system (T2SS) protein F [Motilibacter rhizosphaerae]|uniref:Type II secretion system (T2SS) protein F n=1 Tax=Motilibacter rhizosphaerae TaxID=598652 RepID=A0A4Q7NA67_9ACTN|nr:type II secretion system F family protein [Motilibacter rhizosphaerae]RZS79390.1 type II secretion system (T2SS) protein F [Motilibacter rhizosphaerae]
MSALPLVAGAAAGALVLVAAAPDGRRRLRTLPPPAPAAPSARRPRASGDLRALLPWVVAPVPALLRPDAAHLLLGLLAAACLRRVLAARREPPPRLADLDELAVVLDVLVACLRSGAPLGRALGAASGAGHGPTAGRLRSAGSALGLGAPPEEVAALLAEHALLRPLASVLTGGAGEGVPVADAVAQVAEQVRRERAARATAEVRRLGTRLALPLTGCFLPAFLLVAVVPAVVRTGLSLLA